MKLGGLARRLRLPLPRMPVPPRVRTVAARVTTVLAFLLVLTVLVAPTEADRLTPAGFLRLPVEAALGVALVLVLPPKPRRVVAVVLGVVLGLFAIVRVVDRGFMGVLGRPFDPVVDWPLLDAAMGFLTDSIGRGGAIAAAAGAVVLAAVVLVLTTLAVLRVTRLVVRHDTAAARSAAVLGVAWAVCAVLSVQIVPGVPVAAHSYDRVRQTYVSLQDREAFANEAAVDAFRDAADGQMLAALQGKDVVLVFIESYGRDAVENPRFAPEVGPVLDAGTQRLAAAGFGSRSAWLTSSTVGGASWFAHATLLSGLWVNNQQRYNTLVDSDRLTLNRAFQDAGWRTVAVMPGIFEDWPEGEFFGYDQVYGQEDLGYRGPRMNWGRIPDQYALSVFQRLERARPDRAPVMAELALLSSHVPWSPVPTLVDWSRVGDGSIYEGMADEELSESALRDPDRMRSAYPQAVAYSLNTMISYVETYGDDDLVFMFLGDHQPARMITGEDATADVPISIVARDQAVLDRVSGWGWQAGLKPGPQAPVARMDTFRDRFLSTFGTPAAPVP